jgi:hypothetical protein
MIRIHTGSRLLLIHTWGIHYQGRRWLLQWLPRSPKRWYVKRYPIWYFHEANRRSAALTATIRTRSRQ